MLLLRCFGGVDGRGKTYFVESASVRRRAMGSSPVDPLPDLETVENAARIVDSGGVVVRSGREGEQSLLPTLIL